MWRQQYFNPPQLPPLDTDTTDDNAETINSLMQTLHVILSREVMRDWRWQASLLAGIQGWIIWRASLACTKPCVDLILFVDKLWMLPKHWCWVTKSLWCPRRMRRGQGGWSWCCSATSTSARRHCCSDMWTTCTTQCILTQEVGNLRISCFVVFKKKKKKTYSRAQVLILFRGGRVA